MQETTNFKLKKTSAVDNWRQLIRFHDDSMDLLEDALTSQNNQIAKVEGDLTDVYSASRTYALGELCIKDDQLYRCSTAITTAEAWNAAHWTATTIEEIIKRKALSYSGISVAATGTNTYYDAAMTADYQVANWNFSSGNDNNPPVDLSVTTSDGYFTVTVSAVYTANCTFSPMFVAPVGRTYTTN